MGKLVRDNLGIEPERLITLTNDKAYELALKEKITEEALEVFQSKNDNELIEELADLMEVVKHLLYVRKIQPNKIEEAQREKRILKGGFIGRKFLKEL